MTSKLELRITEELPSDISKSPSEVTATPTRSSELPVDATVAAEPTFSTESAMGAPETAAPAVEATVAPKAGKKRGPSPSSAQPVGSEPGAKADSSDASPPRVRKIDRLMAMVARPGGAALTEIAEAMGVLPHTARAQISVEGRKRGLRVICEKGTYSIGE
jgi:hypothetical protein